MAKVGICWCFVYVVYIFMQLYIHRETYNKHTIVYLVNGFFVVVSGVVRLYCADVEMMSTIDKMVNCLVKCP